MAWLQSLEQAKKFSSLGEKTRIGINVDTALSVKHINTAILHTDPYTKAKSINNVHSHNFLLWYCNPIGFKYKK